MKGILALATLAALVAVTHAVLPVSVNPTIDGQEFTVQEGFRRTFEFTLDEPIICPEQANRECNVVITLTNTHPHELAIDNCHVKWRWDQWTESRFITVTAVEDFIDDGEKMFQLVTEPIISPSEYYNGQDIPDIHFKTAPRPSAVCRATGDPHYTTFDGHPYHVYAPGRVVFYKSTVRDFEVQTDMYSFHRPAVHCAIAAKENNDIVVISLCETGHTVNYRRSCGSDECRRGNYPRVGITGSSNPSYVIEFASGAKVTANINYWSAIGRRYINVYVTAPGVDRGHTQGMCGNNDGNRNNDVNACYNCWIHDLNLLYESQRPTTDLFSWYPNPNEMVTSTLPPFAEECDYREPTFIRPIFNNPDVEDITSLLRESIDESHDAEGVEFDASEVVVPDEISEQDAQDLCESLRTHAVTRACLDVFPGFDLDGFIDQCVDDMIETGGDPDFFEVTINALEDQCGDEGNRDLNTWEIDEDQNPVEPNMELQNTLCPNQCSGHGTCARTRCVCDDGFIGADCSVGAGAVPVVSSIEPATCDSRGLTGCPREISVFGENFWDSADLSCRFGDVVSEARFVTFLEVRCVVPDSVAQSGADVISKNVAITTDGTTFSSNTVPFTWYDAICNICDGATCEPNPESCNIRDTCYLAHQHKDGNVCRICLPDSSSSDWTYTQEDDAECGPMFTSSVYTVELVGTAAANDVLVVVDAVNDLVAGDSDNSITYSFTTDNHVFAVDAQGVITITEDLTITDDLLHNQEFQNLVHVLATDAYGRTDEATLFITLLTTNSRPLFEQSEYMFTVAENAEPGTILGQAQAQDADNAQAEWGSIAYSWSQVTPEEAERFAVDEATGVITLANPVNFEERSSYELQLAARDGGGQSHLTRVVITVEDVNEAPISITLSSASVPENSAVGTIVGAISVTDEDADDTVTLTLADESSTDFAITGSNLVTARAFDYENEDERTLTATITATDAAGNSFTQTVEVSVTNVNEPPTNVRVVGNPSAVITVPETLEENRIVADIAVDDVDSAVVGCVLTNSDSRHFVLQNNRLILDSALDFEMDAEHMVTVMCADDQGAMSEALDITIRVTDAAEGPKNIMFVSSSNGPVPENVAVGTVIGVVSAEDQDADAGAITFAITTADAAVSLGDASCAPVDGTMTCTAEVSVSGTLDYEANNGAYTFVVRATDSSDMFDEEEVTVALADVNDPATGIEWVAGGSVTEDAAPGTEVGRIVVIDQDQGQLFTISLDSTAFEVRQARRRDVSESTGVSAIIVVADSTALSANNPAELTVTVTDTSDSPISTEFSLVVEVTPEPLSIRFAADGTHFAEVSENTPVGTVVASFRVTGYPEGLTPVLSLTPRPRVQTPFVINGLDLVVSGPINYEAYQAYLLDVNVAVDGFDQSITNERFTVVLEDVDEPVVFTTTTDHVFANPDFSNINLFVFEASDPETHHITFSLVEDETDGFVRITSSGNLIIPARNPNSGAAPANGDYTIVVAATVAGAEPVTVTVTVTVHDDCSEAPCGEHGTCIDAFRRYSCECDEGYAGDNCDQEDDGSSNPGRGNGNGNVPTDINGNGIELSSQSQEAGLSTASIAGIVVGLLALLALVALLVFILHRKKDNQELENIYGDYTYQKSQQQQVENPMFYGDCQPLYETAPDFTPSVSNPMYGSYTSDFTPGVMNPLYAWYLPDYSRDAVSAELQSAPVGSFIVRDSTSTHGWHMIGIKTQTGVIHEKIRQTPNGYELLTTNCSKQPEFPDIPSLVGYYSAMQTDVGFVLSPTSFDNPLYAETAALMWGRDADAPAVPLKDSQKDAVRQILESDDFYANTAEAKSALGETSS